MGLFINLDAYLFSGIYRFKLYIICFIHVFIIIYVSICIFVIHICILYDCMWMSRWCFLPSNTTCQTVVSCLPRISWPGGASTADVVDAAAPAVPAPKVAAAGKARAAPRLASSGGGKKKEMEKYSTSYTSISLVPEPRPNVVTFCVSTVQKWK